MGGHLLRQETYGMCRLRLPLRPPLELTMELMGAKPINPKMLAEREGFSLAIFCKLLFSSRLCATALLTACSGAATGTTCSTLTTLDVSISCSSGMDGMD